MSNNETPDIKTQAGKVIGHVAGYVAFRTMDIGLRLGLFEALAESAQGLTPAELAETTEHDRFYTQVWCRSAYAADLIELADDTEHPPDYDPQSRRFTTSAQIRFRLAPHMDKLLLDETFAGYLGGIPGVMLSREFFDGFSERMPSGEGIWWDECSTDFIDAVSRVGRSFYTRMVPNGFAEVPGLEKALEAGGQFTELCCGTGRGLEMIADRYPKGTYTGLDGDKFSVETAAARIAEKGLSESVSFVHSTLEEMELKHQNVVFINISMHECRDIARVTKNVYEGLNPGGFFVISDFAFPARTRELRTLPARLMCGIQFFEAMIDNQLVATESFVSLLGDHGFESVGCFNLTPVHAVTHGRKPG